MRGNFCLILPVLAPIVLGVLVYLMKWKKQTLLRAGAAFALAGSACVACIFMLDDASLTMSLGGIIDFTLRADGMSRIYLALVSVIWPLVALYATEYLEHDANPGRFFLFYLLTQGVLYGISMAGDLITFYLFYELMTIFTLPLVLHTMEKEAVAAAIKYLIYSVIGASAALFGIFFTYAKLGDISFAAGGIAGAAQKLPLWVVFVMIIGFGVKAGMFPMHAWLPTAHPVAPAPASAVLSGIITKMGVLGVLRVVYYVSGAQMLKDTWVQYAFMALSLITVVLGSTMAYKEEVLKKRLAYSSVSQVSYVLFGLSTMSQAGFVGAILHIVFHALMKNGLFMAAGSVIHKTGVTRADGVNGLGKRMPGTMAAFTVCSLGLIGIPPLSGFVSKWMLARGSFTTGGVSSWMGAAALLISAILTAAYLLPIAISAFFRAAQGQEVSPEKSDATCRMLVPMAVMAIGTLVLGMFPGFICEFAEKIAQLIC